MRWSVSLPQVLGGQVRQRTLFPLTGLLPHYDLRLTEHTIISILYEDDAGRQHPYRIAAYPGLIRLYPGEHGRICTYLQEDQTVWTNPPANSPTPPPRMSRATGPTRPPSRSPARRVRDPSTR